MRQDMSTIQELTATSTNPTSPTNKTPKTQLELLEALSVARKVKDSAEITRLKAILADVRRGVEAGEQGLSDPLAPSVPLFGDTELEMLASRASSYTELRESLATQEESQDDPYRITVPTYRLLDDRLVPDVGRVFSVDIVDERSVPGQNLAAFVTNVAMGRDRLRARRVTLTTPAEIFVKGDGTRKQDPPEEWFLERSIPYPQSDSDWKEVNEQYAGCVANWARKVQRGRVIEYCEVHDLIPLPGDPARILDAFRAEQWTIPCIDRQFAIDACPDGLAELHYLKDLFSGVDEAGGIPDWRVMPVMAVTPEQLSLVGEILGTGRLYRPERVDPVTGKAKPTVTDGTSLVFPRVPTEEYLYQHRFEVLPIVGEDGELVWPEVPEHIQKQARKIVQRETAVAERDFQMRCAAIGTVKEGTFRDFKEGTHAVRQRLEWLAKGVLRNFDPEVATMRLKAFLKKVPYGTRLYERYADADRILRWVSQQKNTCALVVIGDQMKVGRSRVRPMSKHTAMVVGTWLKGQPDKNDKIPVRMFAGRPQSELDRLLKREQKRNPGELVGPNEGQPLGYYRADVGFEDGTSEHYDGPVYGGNPVCFHVKDATVRPKTPQFRISGNPQYTQLLSLEAVPDLQRLVARVLRRDIAGRLVTPVGVAQLRSEETGRVRAILDSFYNQDPDEDGAPQRSSVQEFEVGELDPLGEAMLTGLVRLDEEGVSQLYRDGEVQPGHLHMLSAHRDQLDTLVGSAVARIVRAQGISAHYGYLNWTVDNSRKTLNRLNGFEERTVMGLFDPAVGSVAQTGAFARGLLDPSGGAFPEKVIRLLNGDDDGDIIAIIAAIMSTGERVRFEVGSHTHEWTGRTHTRYMVGERLAKFELVGRYPLVDAPVLRAMPIGDRSLGDPQNSEEARDFGEFIRAFRPEIPVGADLFADEVVIAESKRLLRLKDTGAKESIEKVKRSGAITVTGAFKVVASKLVRNRTGRLTRLQERFCVLLAEARAKAAKELAEHGRVFPITSRKLATYATRAARMADLLEEELTGFKYVLKQERRLPMLSHSDDWDEHEELKATVTLSYHENVKRIGAVRRKNQKNQKGPDTLSVEKLLRPNGQRETEKPPFFGWGAGTIIANHAVLTGGREILQRIEAIGTDARVYVRELKRQQKELGEATNEEEVSRVVAALHMWKETWSQAMADVKALHAEADAYEELGRGHEADACRKKAERHIQLTSQSMRAYLVNTGKSVQVQSLIQGLLNRHAEKQAAYEEVLRIEGHLMDNPNTRPEKIEQVRVWALMAERDLENLAAELAMLQGRLFDVFGTSKAQVAYKPTGQGRYRHSVRVFTSGRILPGENGAPLQVVKLDENPEGHGAKALWIATLGGSSERVPFFLADGEGPRFDETGGPSAEDLIEGRYQLVKVSPTRAILMWGKPTR